MSKKRKMSIVFLVMFVVTFLVGCKGDALSKHKVTYEYDKRIEEVKIVNNGSKDVYVDFKVKLLDANKEIIYMETYTEKHFSKSEYYSIDLEDIKPDYISYEKVDSMEVELNQVYGTDNTGTVWTFIILIVTIFAFIFSFL